MGKLRILYALGFTHRGRLEIANGLKELFAGPLKGTRITISPLHIRALSSDVAVEEASLVVRCGRAMHGPTSALSTQVNHSGTPA